MSCMKPWGHFSQPIIDCPSVVRLTTPVPWEQRGGGTCKDVAVNWQPSASSEQFGGCVMVISLARASNGCCNAPDMDTFCMTRLLRTKKEV